MPGEELTDLPPLQGLHTHSFRWDHAIPFARWALGEACPTDITVFLIEAAVMDLGAELSEPVRTGMEQVIELIERDYLAPLRPQAPGQVDVEISAGRERAIGVRARMGAARAASSTSGLVRGVSIQPGAIALTRMPSAAHAAARLFVSCTTPPLDAE
jgi:hypothetical protein